MPDHQQIQQSKKSDTIFRNQATAARQTPVSSPYSIIQRARINPKSLTHADIMQLQRTIGNQAVGRFLSSIGSSSTVQQVTVQRQEMPEEEPLQGKMIETIQRQENPEEEEPLQGKFESIQRQEIPEEEEPLQGKFGNKPEISCPSCFAAPIVQKQDIPEEEEPLQGKMIDTVQLQEIPEEEEPLQTKRENNTGMPDNLKAGVENLSGIDMSDVRVQYNSSKPAEVGALAYTQGTNIHVAPGQERHLPHEAWHVVQQKQGRVEATMQLRGLAVNDDIALEREADVMGEKVFTTGLAPKRLQATYSQSTAMPSIQSISATMQPGVNEVVCKNMRGKESSSLQMQRNSQHIFWVPASSSAGRLSMQGFGQFNSPGHEILQRDPIKEIVIDKDDKSVKKDINDAMNKIKKVVLERAKSDEVRKALSTQGRDAMIYAPIMSWRHNMLGLIEAWDDSWSVEATSGLLLDMGLVMRKFADASKKTEGIMNKVMSDSRGEDKKIDKDSKWVHGLLPGTETQSGVSATTGQLLLMLRSLNVNTPEEIEAIMNGVIKYWNSSWIKWIRGEFHTAAEVWAAYTYHLEEYCYEK